MCVPGHSNHGNHVYLHLSEENYSGAILHYEVNSSYPMLCCMPQWPNCSWLSPDIHVPTISRQDGHSYSVALLS